MVPFNEDPERTSSLNCFIPPTSEDKLPSSWFPPRSLKESGREEGRREREEGEGERAGG
jgi:hypothetical protein